MRWGNAAALLLLGALPLALGLLWFAERRLRARLDRFGAAAHRLVEGRSPGRRRLREALLLLAALFLVTAAARPQWGREEREVTLAGVDVVLAIDTSFSMDARDVAPSRMERARYIAASLLERLAGNRVGIVAFSGTAFTSCPLTPDLGAARTLLAGVATGAVESPGTNLAAMMEEAVRAFEREGSAARVVVLLTDGQQDDLRLTPVAEVAGAANAAGITVLAVGVGTSGGATIPVPADGGPSLMRDSAGSPIVSRLDTDTLSRLAALTGGAFYEVSPDDREIEGVAGRIAGLAGGGLGEEVVRRHREQFWIPAGLAAAALFAYGMLPGGVRRERFSAPPRAVPETAA